MISRKIFLILILFVYLFGAASAQQITDRNTLESQSRFLIDCPTANISPKRSLEMTFRSFSNGGTLFGMSIAIRDNLMILGSFGGENLLGEGTIRWNPSPGVGFRYQVSYENFQWPALSIGFDSQGFDAWQDSTGRFRIKSKGFYAAMSKNYSALFDLGIHGGINYSLERGDGDSDINIFLGMNWNINAELAVHGEYDFAINDNGPRSMGGGKGYLNAGGRWYFVQALFGKRLFIEVDVRNIFKNTKVKIGENKTKLNNNRILRLVYMEYF